MAPRRGGGIHIGGGGSVGGGGIKCTNCDTTLNSMYFNLISDANTYGQLIPNVIFAAALLGVFFINRRPAAKLAQLATFCFFTACVFQSVRWGLITHNIEIPHGYRCEASIIVMMQRVGWPVLLAALLRAMRPGKILGAGPWAGLFVLSVLNVTYVVYDFILTDLAIKDFKMSEVFWSLSDRDFGSLWSKSMVDRFTDQPEDNDYRIKWSQDDALRYRAWNVYMASGSPNRKDRDTQIKIGLAADVVALLVVLALGGLHAVTWRRQGKAELPRRRVSFPNGHMQLWNPRTNATLLELYWCCLWWSAAFVIVPCHHFGALDFAQLENHPE